MDDNGECGEEFCCRYREPKADVADGVGQDDEGECEEYDTAKDGEDQCPAAFLDALVVAYAADVDSHKDEGRCVEW